MKRMCWNMICGYCGHKNYGQVPLASDELNTDCEKCGAWLIAFENVDLEKEK